MDNALERDIQTLGRTEGNLRFLFNSYIDGRVDYEMAKTAITSETIFLERLVEVRLGGDYVLLNILWDLKNSLLNDENAEHSIMEDSTTLIAVSRIVLKRLKEVRDK